jgi:phosphoribosylformylglycinamidine synthase
VQVGDPFTEELLIEACLELMAGDAIVSIQDMGAAGLTSSSFEMASKGGVGIELDLDRVPVRETAMSAYEIMLSESQERMLMVLKPGAEETARQIFEKWELDFAIVGRVTDTGRMVLRELGEVIGELPIVPLVSASPEYDRPWRETSPAPDVVAAQVPAPESLSGALATLLACPDGASKRWIWEQYDHLIMGDTVQRPGGDAAVVRLRDSNRALAITTDCTPRYCAADPRQGGAQAVAEAWRNLTAAGARPLGITDCLNFGSPERPEVMGQFVGAIQGMGEACRALDFPVVSGNVSFYNETNGRAVQPTPTVGGVGLIDDLAGTASPALKSAGETLVLIGETLGHLGASLYLREVLGREDGAPPPVDLSAERRNGDLVRALVTAGRVSACHDVSDGGVAVAVAEMALAGGVGARLEQPEESDAPAHAWFFGEDQGRYVLSLAPETAARILDEAAQAGVSACRIGTTGGLELTFDSGDTISLSELRAAHESWLPGYLASP